MNKDGINKITSAYIITANSVADDILKWKSAGKQLDESYSVDVTTQVQDAFKTYWESWGHKQAMASHPNSFCSSLKRAVNGDTKRPTNGGPYKLVICYKYHGRRFYRELIYDKDDKLEIEEYKGNKVSSDDIHGFLRENRFNICFVGEKLTMTKEEFIERMKRIPLLTEFMRLHISVNSSIAPIRQAQLTVHLFKEDKCTATINFCLDNGRTSKPKYNSEKKRFILDLPKIHDKNILIEIKEIIFSSMEDLSNDPNSENIEAFIQFDPVQYSSHELQFF